MSNENLLDAWNDFSRIKHILSDINESIVIVLGASWCHKCDPIKKKVLQLTEQDTPGVHWLWLDLEDHCEFLGDYSPETIPLVWVYQGKHLIRYGTIKDDNTTTGFSEFIQSIPIAAMTPSESNIRLFLLAEYRAA